MEGTSSYDIELLPKEFKEVMTKVKENLDKKREEFKKELEEQKKSVINSFISNYKSVNEIKSNDKNLDENEIKLLQAHEDELKTFINNLGQMSFNELANNKVLEQHEDEKIKDVEIDDLPAHLCPKDRCKNCKTKYVYNKGCYMYYNNCTNSDICNTNYRYYCPTCALRFCTQCVHPPKIDFCGCGVKLSIMDVSYHACDICRESIVERCHRCANCDYDVCFRCYDRIKAEEIPNEEDEVLTPDTDKLNLENSSSINQEQVKNVRKGSIEPMD